MPLIPVNDFKALLLDFARDVKADLTSDDAKAELALLVSDFAALEARMTAEADPTKKQRYSEALERLVAHATTMFLSRLNVKQGEAGELAERILVASLRILAKAVLGPLGALL